MITFRDRLPGDVPFDDELVLPFERRQHSRLLAKLTSGREAALLLPRGTVLRHGDRITGLDPGGQRICARIVAASEDVYDVTGERLIRAAYHLGNRHVPLQLGEGFLRMERDPVLRDMLLGLGFAVLETTGSFEPEPGAYDSASADGPAHPHLHHHGDPPDHGRGAKGTAPHPS